MWVIKANRASTNTRRFLPIFHCLNFPGSSFIGAPRWEQTSCLRFHQWSSKPTLFKWVLFPCPFSITPSTLITFIRKFTITLFYFVMEAQPDKKEGLCTNFVLSGSVNFMFQLSHNFSLNSLRFQNFRRFMSGGYGNSPTRLNFEKFEFNVWYSCTCI